jgi:hypothetical protein
MVELYLHSPYVVMAWSLINYGRGQLYIYLTVTLFNNVFGIDIVQRREEDKINVSDIKSMVNF